MGAYEFTVHVKAATAADAFDEARAEAGYEKGFGGYTGTIVEKNSFIMVEVPEGRDRADYIQELLSDDDSPVSDKWGPAGCIKIAEGEFVFFGCASS